MASTGHDPFETNCGLRTLARARRLVGGPDAPATRVRSRLRGHTARGAAGPSHLYAVGNTITRGSSAVPYAESSSTLITATS